MKKIIVFSLILLLTITGCGKKEENSETKELTTYKVNISNLEPSRNDLKYYTESDYEEFLSDYNSNKLPNVYITEFLFDGVSIVKSYDLDNFIDDGNEATTKLLSIKVINIHKAGNYELTGELIGGMIAVNTNDLDGDIDITLNGVKIDTDSKKAPAVYVYNRDITYNKYKVTIKTSENTKNYLEGGKLKKVSLIGSDELSSYASNYSGENLTNYNTYTNYYGVYTSSEVEKVLFAKEKADREALSDGDPYYYYKASGAISSDIDLYFEGKGYLEVTSKNKEGIESKGNLTFSGGTGDYSISSMDDCLNTTTDSENGKNIHNTITIDVHSLKAIVSLDSDEGDAIDSNGQLIINDGTIYAFSKPGQDSGLDSNKGTYINGGTIISTGDMYDEIKSDSKQKFIALSFQNKVKENTLISLLDSNNNVIFSFINDRNYTNLIYSSNTLKEGTYYLYQEGEIIGTNENGMYTNISNYNKGTQMGYANSDSQGGMKTISFNSNDITPPDDNMKNGYIKEKTDNTPDDIKNSNRFEKTDMNGKMTPPNNGNMPMMPNNQIGNFIAATNKEFIINGISNLFSGVAVYTEEN